MRTSLNKRWRKQRGIVSVETALIFPVLLFMLVMFFELARIALVISVVNTSLERAVQNLRHQDDFYSTSQSDLSTLMTDRVVSYSYDLVSKENIQVDVHTFSNLGMLSGTVTSGDSDDDDAPEYTNAPVMTLTLTLTQNFITPLPKLFNLGSSYQHEFQQVLADLVVDEDESS